MPPLGLHWGSVWVLSKTNCPFKSPLKNSSGGVLGGEGWMGVAEAGANPCVRQHESCAVAVCTAGGGHTHRPTRSVLSNAFPGVSHRAVGSCCAPGTVVRTSSGQLLSLALGLWNRECCGFMFTLMGSLPGLQRSSLFSQFHPRAAGSRAVAGGRWSYWKTQCLAVTGSPTQGQCCPGLSFAVSPFAVLS